MPDTRALWAETFGTFWLVFGGCGSAVFAAAFPTLGIGFAGVSLAFGLTVLTMAYAVGHISGGHFNPAVTVGLWAGGRFAQRDVLPYIVAQVVGAIIAAFTLYWLLTGQPGWELGAGKLASNGFDGASPGKFGMGAAFVAEVLLTAMFLMIIMGSTHKLAAAGAAPIAIGLALSLIHLISIPITNTSVNPARSTGPALVEGGVALQQLWLFWLAPMIGGVLGGIGYRTLLADND